MWHTRSTVREKQAEDAFVASATARGIDAQVARNVIRDQMVASKMVQYELISKWKVTPPPVRPYKDLAKELRPVIDAATARLTSGLADAVATGIPADWRTQVQRSADSAARSLDVAVSRAALGINRSLELVPDLPCLDTRQRGTTPLSSRLPLWKAFSTTEVSGAVSTGWAW